MSGDRRRPEQHAPPAAGSARDGALASWIAEVVHPHGAEVRAALDRSRLGRNGVQRVDDLRRLPLTPLAELGDGRSWVLEPTADSLARAGPLADRVRLQVADAFGRRPELARQRVDPDYRPVVWTAVRTPSGPLFVASTATDLERLAAIGRRALPLSGVGREDRVVVLGAPLSGLPGWQLVAGCRDAGVAHLHVGDGPGSLGLVRTAAPTVVAGDRDALDELVEVGLPTSVRCLVELDDRPAGPPPPEASDVPRSQWWSPPGSRLAWVRCAGGSGFHTHPAYEVVETVDGQLVWSPLGWRGSVWLRLGTGVEATVRHGACSSCGRPGPLVEPVLPPAWVEVVESAREVAAWLGVRRGDGSLVMLVVPAPDAADGWRAALAAEIGMKVVPITADRYGRARALADGAVVDEAIVAPALRKAVPS